MNIEAYDVDSLRKMVRLLEYENKILKDKLKKAGISYEEVNPFEEKIESAEEYDLDQGNRIVNPPYITEKMAIRFFSMFWGREDVYARRGKNGGYFPQCANRWNDRLCPKQRKEKVLCDECENTKWISLDVKKIIDHLLGTKEDGSDVIGVYPLLPNGTCRFIVFDFDNHEKGAEVTDFANTDNEWHKEVDALRKMCELNGIRPLVERSRSGKGAHVWIFFKKAIPAATARNFGFLLLDKGSTSINLKSFHYYDRMYPSQDVASSIGNLIALPLQGQALKNGNSAFVDENWNAYPDQWDALKEKADHVFLLYGDNSDKENAEIRVKLKQIPENESLILVATGQKIGEGFDFPRLDVLMLAAPVSFEGRLEQYVGRLNRDYVGKEAVYVYDYIDSHVRYFDKMYAKRLRTYRKMGFSIWMQELQPKQIINAIFDSVNYTEKFEQDIVESEKMVVISSPDIRQDKIDRFLLLVKKRQEVGVKVTVITTDSEDITYGKSDVCYELIRAMQLVGINVITRTEVEECFAVIDDEIVWHGGMNLLGKADVWDNLMRIRNSQVATELLEIALGCSEERRKSE